MQFYKAFLKIMVERFRNNNIILLYNPGCPAGWKDFNGKECLRQADGG